MDAVRTPRVRLFSRKWEFMTLFLGLLPATFLFWNPGWMTERWQLQFIGEVLFLNAVHTGFSIFLIWRSQEIRRAISQAFDGQPWRLHLKALGVFVACAMLAWYIQSSGKADQATVITLLMWIQFFSIHHAMSQQLGLSLLYDRRTRQMHDFNPQELSRLTYLNRLERNLNNIALVGIGIRCFSEGTLGAGLPLPGGHITWYSGYVIFGGATLGIIGLQFFRPKWRNSNQWIFNMRRAWSIFPIFNYHLMVLRKLNHGFEYLAVTRTIEKNSQPRKIAGLNLSWPLFLLVSVVVGFWMMNYTILNAGPTPFDWLLTAGTPFFSAFSVGCTMSHYYYDSQIYKFSKAPFREHVLPLMTEPLPAVSTAMAERSA